MNVDETDRGFEIIEFNDANGVPSSLQQSSAIRGDFDKPLPSPGTTAVWLGRAGERMHLERQQVAELVEHLSAWLKTGSFQGEAK